MFTEIEARNFRQFEKVTVGPLRRVNLITGRNGAGKTSFLEAVFLVAGASNASLVLSIYNFRNESNVGPKIDRMFRSVFKDMDIERTPSIRAVGGFGQGNNGPNSSRTLKIEAVASEDTLSFGDEVAGIAGVRFVFVGPSGKASSEMKWERYEDVDETGNARQVWRFGGLRQKSPDLINSYFVSPYYREIWKQTHKLLTDAIKAQRLGEIIDSLKQVVEPNVRNLLPLSEAGQEVIYVDLGGPNLLPLSVLGSGFVHLLNLLLQANSLKNGILLIDELEDGIHYSLLEAVIELLISLATRNNLQVFITTHSNEVLETFAAISEKLNFEDVSLVKMARQEGSVSGHVFDVADLLTSREADIEVR